ncbi:major facilitator transporter [Caballeronia fortuita]|uniref:Major facilitator transporter n=1 Tax=Caballeronia fortuita TaxID=1777138 RepID=A0A157ZPA4_9BURK|nr:MFS transporter [Caballeronia fortuita]SAK47348.1 major facilitator transporter [Caballeronia fortuita]
MTTQSVMAGPRLDRMPLSGFHTKMLWLVGGGLFLDGFDVYLAGGVLGSLLKSGWSTLAMNAFFVTATFAGMVVGAFMSGVLGDRYGRRFSYQVNLAIFGLASFAGAFAPSMEWLIFFRLVMGIGLGAELAIGYATLSEFVPAAKRGRWIALLALIANASLFASSLLAWIIIPALGWRPMFLIVGVGAAVIWMLRKKMPESPRWLEEQGRFDEAEAILRDIEEQGERATGKPLPPLAPIAAAAPAQKRQSIFVLFTPAVIRRTFLGATFSVVQGLSVYGLVGWLPSFFVKEGVSVASSLGYTTVMSLGGPLGALIGFLLSDRIGRRPLMVGASAFTALCAFVYPLTVHNTPLLLVVGLLLVTSIFVWLTIGYTLQTELFATEYRLRGTGFCQTMGRLVTAFVQFIVVSLFTWGGVTAVITSLAGVLIVQALIFLIAGIETKRKPLEALTPEAADGAAFPADMALNAEGKTR